jgi:predicted Zn finger-like uncharacterized protein
MIVVCPSCRARYKFDEAKLGDRPKAKTKCAKCGATIEIENPRLASHTLPPAPMVVAPAAPQASAPSFSAPSSPPDTKKTKPVSPPETPVGDAGATITGRDLHKAGVLELPKDKRFSLAVIQGAATGHIFQIGKTSTLIGRTGADINLDDPECSRQHAVLEIYGETAILRDLDSTNGTFMDLDRIEQKLLQNQMEFRIGSHVLMFIVTEVE